MPGMFSEVARGGGLYAVAGSDVGAGADVGVAAGAASFPAAAFAGVRLVSILPPTPAVTAVAAVTPPTVMNLRRSKVVVIGPSSGCRRAPAGAARSALTHGKATAVPRRRRCRRRPRA